MKSDILFVCETMCTTHAAVEELIDLDGKNLHTKKAIKTKKQGRSSGGLAFLVNKEFVGSLTIMWVYLTYENGSLINQLELQSELAIVQTIIDESRKKNREFIIIGDFKRRRMRQRAS